MKKVSLILFAMGFITLNAHSGGTNSAGCHNDWKNGGYHCHKSAEEIIKVKPVSLNDSKKINTENNKKDHTNLHSHS